MFSGSHHFPQTDERDGCSNTRRSPEMELVKVEVGVMSGCVMGERTWFQQWRVLHKWSSAKVRHPERRCDRCLGRECSVVLHRGKY